MIKVTFAQEMHFPLQSTQCLSAYLKREGHETDVAIGSADEIVNYLRTGFTPDFDSSGGLMAEVIENLQPLNDEELKEIAHYLKSIAPIVTKKSN